MNVIIFDVVGRVGRRKSRCCFQQLVRVAKLLIFAPQPGIFCFQVLGQVLKNVSFTSSFLDPLPSRVPRYSQLRRDNLTSGLHRKPLSEDPILHQANNPILRTLTKLHAANQISPSIQTEQNLGQFTY